MNGYRFTFHGAALVALASGALYWPEAGLLCVSDLHLGKSERQARLGRSFLPPYEVTDTLTRLDAALAETGARHVVCLGDSFDDADALAGLRDDEVDWLLRLQAGRQWSWVEGNHDPGPIGIGGSHLAVLYEGALCFRHIAIPGARAEISGHYHPKAALPRSGRSRPAFLVDADRIVMPAFGTYTGGLRASDPVLASLMQPDALAIQTGPRAIAFPLYRAAAR